MQEVQEKEGVTYRKVLGTDNPADLMTKYLSRDMLNGHMKRLGQEVREGRAEKGLEMQGVAQDGPRATNVKVA